MENNTLGKRMKWLREKKDLKQNKVAETLGITAYQLSRYESGKSKPDPKLIASIANYYDVTTDYLLGHNSQETAVDPEEDEKTAIINKIAKDFPNADLMFHDMANMDADQLQEVYEFIKFKMSQKDK
ncbi:helix-turn-helix transcriptional regulator [Barrientosiimonas marina]|uniref:Helix-turn-helix domain-containing protein n=1 Tax=Lentibacillus kimchii TaxID=1542911 RepID=A0ABW2UW92_9BACI